ncbi:cation:proton antiporter [Porphyromonas cangingivalis]|uniref:cation:proton antiporter n=1 Tax=Porphyromonas cangingivalis TaxID=36874 RepID=UPI00242A7B93|nr:cation:proton antiporter [Porphyromonas cangingivalis]
MSLTNKRKDVLFYIILLVLGAGVLWYVSSVSSTPEDALVESKGLISRIADSFGTFIHFVREHLSSQFGLLLIQIIVILLFARAVAWCFTKIGQPSVIGEILAGIILGPSVLGLLFPNVFETLFPSESLHNISLLSQFGLILFMFVIGMELELGEIKKTLRKTLVISHAGIIIPFVLGAILSIALFDDYAGAHGELLPFALFIGISMSITAFPVLARIIQEKGQMNTHIGVLSLSSAASGDITAWCLIAVIMAIAQAGSAMSALFTIIFASVYMLVMFYIVRPIFKLVGKLYNNSEVLTKGVIAIIFLTLLISAYLTEILGLHALFGAFIAGVVMPENLKFRRLLTEKVEDVSLSIFLPLFFVASGLQTEIGLLNTGYLWMITLVITAIAVIGKLGGTYIAARVVGENKYNSLYMGILMNTRGLMELVILSMGYQLGILSPIIYAMLVLMTLVTTFMTTPLLELLDKIMKPGRKAVQNLSNSMQVLFSFGRTSTGMLMLQLMHTFFPNKGKGAQISCLHMTVGSDTNPRQAEHFREQNFAPLKASSKERGLEVEEYYEVTDNPVSTLVNTTKSTEADLLLIGAPIELSRLPEDEEINKLHKNVVNKVGHTLAGAGAFFNVAQLLRDKTKYLIDNTPNSIGVVIDRGLREPVRSLCVIHDPQATDKEDYAHLVNGLLRYTLAEKHFISIGTGNDIEEMKNFYQADPMTMKISFAKEELGKYDLLLIPYNTFRNMSAQSPELLEYIPTTILLCARRKSPFPTLTE